MRQVLRFLSAMLQYCAAVGGATIAALLLLPLVGYSPYGDRPPAGWYPLGAISPSEYLEHAEFVGEFALVLLLPSLAFYFLPAAGLVALVDRSAASRSGRVAARIGIVGAASFVSIAAAAWYISMGWIPLAAGMLGSVTYSICCMRVPARPRSPAI